MKLSVYKSIHFQVPPTGVSVAMLEENVDEEDEEVVQHYLDLEDVALLDVLSQIAIIFVSSRHLTEAVFAGLDWYSEELQNIDRSNNQLQNVWSPEKKKPVLNHPDHEYTIQQRQPHHRLLRLGQVYEGLEPDQLQAEDSGYLNVNTLSPDGSLCY